MFGFIKKKKKNDLYLPVLRAEQLLGRDKNPEAITSIKRNVGVSERLFDELYLYSIRQCAELVQSCPASEAHHHAQPGGLLAHILESCAASLQMRKGRILPVGESPEISSRLADLYTYAVFAGALLHDIAKPLTDQTIQIYDRKKEKIKQGWNPLYESIPEIKGARWMTIEFRTGRDYRHHEKSALLLLHRVLLRDGFSWLLQEKNVYSEFLDAFSESPAGPIYELMKKGDQLSVSRALGASTVSQFTKEKPLWMKIKTAIRFLVDSGELSLNRPGAAGWVNDRGLWLVSKRAVDAIREQLVKEGQSGIPTDNTRMFDVMSEGGLLILNETRAIWRCRVALDKFDSTFSLLLLPLDAVWGEPSKAPRFTGSITATSNVESNEDEAAVINTAVAADDAVTPPGATTAESDGGSTDDQRQDMWKLFTPSSSTDTSTPVEVSVLDDEASPPAKTGHNESKPAGSPGQNFLRWLENGINKEIVQVNTAEALIHILREGIFIVSPLIFDNYAAKHSLKREVVQKEFQRLKINLKTPQKNENVFRVRIFGKKMSMLNGWIIPLANLNVERELEVNEHLTLLKGDE